MEILFPTWFFGIRMLNFRFSQIIYLRLLLAVTPITSWSSLRQYLFRFQLIGVVTHWNVKFVGPTEFDLFPVQPFGLGGNGRVSLLIDLKTCSLWFLRGILSSLRLTKVDEVKEQDLLCRVIAFLRVALLCTTVHDTNSGGYELSRVQPVRRLRLRIEIFIADD